MNNWSVVYFKKVTRIPQLNTPKSKRVNNFEIFLINNVSDIQFRKKQSVTSSWFCLVLQ